MWFSCENSYNFFYIAYINYEYTVIILVCTIQWWAVAIERWSVTIAPLFLTLTRTLVLSHFISEYSNAGRYTTSKQLPPYCAKHCRGKPALIMHIACFHAINLEPSRLFHVLVAMKLLILLVAHLIAFSARISMTQTLTKYFNPHCACMAGLTIIVLISC